ncbi:MAG: hypothetical protein LBH80_07670 [Prevotellaceae bacterium]|jgi:hypothetical protein|nr:hypothetical protein [Prevotellaceae bacterium]
MHSSLLVLFKTALDFLKKDFHPAAYIYTFALAFTLIAVNYSTDLYQTYIVASYHNGNSVRVFFMFYTAVYFCAAIPVLLLRKSYDVLGNPAFYFKSLFFIFLYALSVGFYDYHAWTIPSLTNLDNYYIFRLISRFKSCVCILLPLFLYKTLFDKKIEGVYGLTKNSKHLDAYSMVFLMLLPFLIGVSFTSDFLTAYPQFRPWRYANALELPVWLNALLYEVVYALDFVNTELLFRGAMVIGMTAIMGPKAVLPMIVFYASIHFGKPLGETVSSVFGGYVLGTLACQTKHIWGGVIAHIGIALTMEIMGFVHHYLLGS